MNNLNRAEWLSKTGVIFNFHRDIAVLVLGLNFLLFRFVHRKYALKTDAHRMLRFSLNLITLQLLTGLALEYLALQPVAQALHILLASLLFGSQFYMFLSLNKDLEEGSAAA
jgi:cytochrome c oxidase assembly protein subunit 15